MHVALDFDGVLHSYSSGWMGGTIIPDPPITGAIEFMKELFYQVDELCILSARAETPEAIQAMRQWLFKYGLPYNIAFGIEITNRKHGFDYLLDDRAHNFSGVFPDVSAVLAFQPWNKKGK